MPDHVGNDEIEKETIIYLRVMWNNRQGHERWPYYGLL